MKKRRSAKAITQAAGVFLSRIIHLIINKYLNIPFIKCYNINSNIKQSGNINMAVLLQAGHQL